MIDDIQENAGNANNFTFEVLQIIKQAQLQHGLRHGDYQRYRFLYLPLVDSERCWAFAMQLKSEANTEPRKKFHMLSKLKKAVQHTEKLMTLCESDKCDARTKLEAQAYSAWMKGTLHIELENWRKAIEYFTSAKTIYGKLSGTFIDETKDIYLQKCEEISPNIRYCAFNIGDESAINDLMQMRLASGRDDIQLTRLDEMIEKTREKQAATLSEVTWRGRTVPVKNEQVRISMLSIREGEKQLIEANSLDSKLSIYESFLKELIEAQQALKDDMRDDPTFRAAIRGQQMDGRVSNGVYLHTYLCFLRQTKTLERNLLMVEALKQNLPGIKKNDTRKATKPQDLARLYDIVIQSLSEIPNLPGLEEDSALGQEISAQILCCKAFRCFYIAQSYVLVKKWREALALYERTLEYGREALEGYKNVIFRGNTAKKQKQTEELQVLIAEVEGQKYTCHASSIIDLENLTEQISKVSVKNAKPLIEMLDVYGEDTGMNAKKPDLCKFPPEFEPIPCKPLFFDVALSLVELPSLETRLEQKKQQGGITGLVKGWLWGGKN